MLRRAALVMFTCGMVPACDPSDAPRRGPHGGVNITLSDNPVALAVAPDGDLVVATMAGSLTLRRISVDGDERWQIPIDATVEQVGFLGVGPQGLIVLVIDRDRITTFREDGTPGWERVVSFATDVAIGGNDEVVYSNVYGLVNALSSSDGTEQGVGYGPNSKGNGTVAIGPDGRIAYIENDPTEIYLFRPALTAHSPIPLREIEFDGSSRLVGFGGGSPLILVRFDEGGGTTSVVVGELGGVAVPRTGLFAWNNADSMLAVQVLGDNGAEIWRDQRAGISATIGACNQTAAASYCALAGVTASESHWVEAFEVP